MKLWLDDVRDPTKYGAIGFVWVKTAKEAIEKLATGKVTFASLDHDLNEYLSFENRQIENTGYNVILWMEEHNVWPEEGVRVHSMNPVGKKRMEQVIRKQYGRLFK